MAEVIQADQSLRPILIDDEPRLTDLLGIELEEEGYVVQIVSNISEDWQALQVHLLPEIIVSDWSLPDGRVPDLCERMRKN